MLRFNKILPPQERTHYGPDSYADVGAALTVD